MSATFGAIALHPLADLTGSALPWVASTHDPLTRRLTLRLAQDVAVAERLAAALHRGQCETLTMDGEDLGPAFVADSVVKTGRWIETTFLCRHCPEPVGFQSAAESALANATDEDRARWAGEGEVPR